MSGENEEGRGVTRRQALGVATILLGLACGDLAVALRPDRPVPLSLFWSEAVPGSVAMELAGDTGKNGIYHVPNGATAGAWLDMLGLSGTGTATPGLADRKLATGATLDVQGGKIRSIRSMAAATRLALGVPLDVNSATREDLVLVPGIGEKTAEDLVRFREREGGIRTIEELLQIPGIKEKRLAALRPYLAVEQATL